MSTAAPRPYRIEFAAPAVKQFTTLARAVQERIAPRIDSLALEPRPHGVEKLKGALDQYRIRVGAYRIIYQLRDEVLTVLVLRIGRRRDVYRR